MKGNILEIDLNQWQTQQEAANAYIKEDGSKGCTIQYISKLINKGKVDSLDLSKQIGIVLVSRNLQSK